MPKFVRESKSTTTVLANAPAQHDVPERNALDSKQCTFVGFGIPKMQREPDLRQNRFKTLSSVGPEALDERLRGSHNWIKFLRHAFS